MNRVVWNLYFYIKQRMLDANIMLQAGRAVDAKRVKEVISLLKPVRIQSRLIRIGGDGDGGYLVPDDLDGIEYCFSPGVSDYAPFEIELERRGIRSFLADYSVDGMPSGLTQAKFIKKYITLRKGADSITLRGWMDECLNEGYKPDTILQMDIERQEYEVLLGLDVDYMKKFRIMIIEFHGLHGMFDKVQLGLVEYVFQKITNEFYVVHLHPNNFAPLLCAGEVEIPDLMEITFLRKDRSINESGYLTFPHPLDRRCSDIRADFALPKCWYF